MYLGINCTSSSVKDYAAVWLRAVAAVLLLTLTFGEEFEFLPLHAHDSES